MLDLTMVARRLRKTGRGLTLRGAQPDISVLIEYVGLHRLPGVTSRPRPRPPESFCGCGPRLGSAVGVRGRGPPCGREPGGSLA